jgi:DNA-directed RNA polymerase subunit RPC12/RpoP
MPNCNYYRESDTEMYTPECEGVRESVHEDDIEGGYCQFCGSRIVFKEYTPVPARLDWGYLG